MSEYDFSGIIRKFMIRGNINESFPYGNGHINSTYRLVNRDSDFPDYLLQRVNHEVFTDISGMMQNIEYVTSHIRKKLVNQQLNYYERVLTLVHTTEGSRYVEYQGQFWRLFKFMSSLQSYDEAPTIHHAYEGAHAFGNFLNQLSDFEPSRLNVTIHNFHDLNFRLGQLFEAIEVADEQRLSMAKEELYYVSESTQEMLKLHEMTMKGVFPMRVVHNDTKFNNVLFNGVGKASCVIDLDTVMPGFVHYDFGDGVRTGTVTCSEDSEDLQSVDLDIEKFEAFTQGYLDGVGNVLTKEELATLPLSTAYMAYIIGVRFLTDYLRGDVYYKVKYPSHNHVRAKCQLKLSEILRLRLNEMDQVINGRAKIFL